MTTQEKSETQPRGWEDCPGVARNPRRVGGAWTFGNTRLPLYIVFQNLASGATIEEVAQWFEGWELFNLPYWQGMHWLCLVT